MSLPRPPLTPQLVRMQFFPVVTINFSFVSLFASIRMSSNEDCRVCMSGLFPPLKRWLFSRRDGNLSLPNLHFSYRRKWFNILCVRFLNDFMSSLFARWWWVGWWARCQQQQHRHNQQQQQPPLNLGRQASQKKSDEVGWLVGLLAQKVMNIINLARKTVLHDKSGGQQK